MQDDRALREYFKEYLSKDEKIIYGEINRKAESITRVFLFFAISFFAISSIN